MSAAVQAREELQRLTWQIEANTDALDEFRRRVLPQLQTIGEQSGARVNSATDALERAIENTRLEMAFDND